MSSLHLTEGSERPPLVEGKLRLYSMKYCPYAQRSRLVLHAKNVPHDVVNVNLVKKPSWIFDVHPEGKVPALDTGSKIVVDSTDICDFLDEQYPDPPLYSNEEASKQQEKDLIKSIGPLTLVFYSIMLQKEKKSAEEWLQDLTPHLQVLEDKLNLRGTLYFGGDKPGMMDYMLWPWAERAGTITAVLGERLPLKEGDIPCLRAWRKAMRMNPAVEATYNSPEKFYKVVLFTTTGLPAEYDSI